MSGELSEAYAYDIAGNLVGYTDPKRNLNEDGYTAAYKYDELNRITEVKDALNQLTCVSYTILGDISSVVLKQTAAGGNTATLYTKFYNELGAVKSKTDASSLATQYSYNTIGLNTNYLYNGHGDVIQIVDRNGNVVNNYKYDEWGNVLTSSETISNPFLYAGEVYDKETGLYYLRARYYDPSVGRFINEDTVEGQIDNPLSMNLYSYCYNNPLIYTDPSGHKVKWTQWDNLIGSFIKTGWDITKNNMGFDIISNIKNATAMIDLIGKIVNGKINLDYVIKNALGGDLDWLTQNWYIISDNKTYSNSVINEFGAHLAGAYSELVNIITFDIAIYTFDNSFINVVGGTRIKSIIFDSKQLGKKWGEHMKDYPSFNNYTDYQNYANEIFKNPENIIFDTANNEWYYIKGNDLLRLKPDGTFISLYPGAQSSRVTNLQ